MTTVNFAAGSLVHARGREWIVLPDSARPIYRLRPINGTEDEIAVLHADLEPDLQSAVFNLPSMAHGGTQEAALMLRDALLLGLRRGAGPFPSLAGIAVEPRAYQLVPLLMALKLDPVRLLIADDVGLGKTIEAALVVKELMERGLAQRMAVLCPPHLVEQWVGELRTRFHLPAVAVTSASAPRLERELPQGVSLFDTHPVTVVSLDYIKADKRRDDFARSCPELILVDEAHTCTMGGAGRHQRHEVLSRLLEGTTRHALLLTATPHSGDEDAFWRLLGLLRPEFRGLATATEAQRNALRERLALHFVQRRRPDIEEWRDGSVFPKHLRGERTYRLQGRREKFLQAVLDYCHAVTVRAGDDKVAQRLSFWGTLALLRCVASSPAAAASALATRLGKDTDATVFEEALYDDDAESFGADDVEPPADDGAAEIRALLTEARALADDPEGDPKFTALRLTIDDLRKSGHQVVVFCQYIATAESVGAMLRDHLPSSVTVEVITGQLSPDERRAKVATLVESEDRVLVATDCLSEGVNLQHGFDAVVHFDLSWNPVRHEQREGRVDRFGQLAKTVRSILIYGEDNPVDGAVLEVILRKAEAIRKELGVSVPLPEDRQRMTEALLKTVLLRGGRTNADQLTLDLGATKPVAALETAWKDQAERTKATVTRFAQRRLKPEEVQPELERMHTVLGTTADVDRFVRTATGRLGAAASTRTKGGLRIPVSQLPPELAERARLIGVPNTLQADPVSPPSAGAEHLHRTHPFVGLLADTLLARALDDASLANPDDPAYLARAGAWPVLGITERVTILLCRIRYQVEVRRGARGTPHTSLVEEAVLHAVSGLQDTVLPEDMALTLLSTIAAGTLPDATRRVQLAKLGERLPALRDSLAALAESRAEQLREDHARVTAAARDDALRHHVTPVLPVDVIGAWVLLPAGR
jgi:superfamily II DNA or RNA helicase